MNALQMEQEAKNENQNLPASDDMHRLEIKLESKNDTYRDMFWTGIIQLLAILGSVIAIVKFMI